VQWQLTFCTKSVQGHFLIFFKQCQQANKNNLSLRFSYNLYDGMMHSGALLWLPICVVIVLREVVYVGDFSDGSRGVVVVVLAGIRTQVSAW